MLELLAVAVVVTMAGIGVLVRRSRRGASPVRDEDVAGSGRRVLVAVAHPASAEGLGDLAAAVARFDRGRVEAICVIDEGSVADVTALAEETVSRCRTAVIDGGVEATQRVRVDASVGHGVLHRAVELDASLVVLGWPGTGEDGVSAGIAPAIRDGPAPLLLARLQGYRWDRIRVCVPASRSDAGLDASLRLATEVSERIGRTRGVPVVREPVGPSEPTVRSTAADGATELKVVPVAPHRGAVQRAIDDAAPFGDLVLALCHGPEAREHRPLLASAGRLYDVATSSPSR